MAMFATILKRDRIRNGMTEAQLARRLGVSVADYRAVEAGDKPATLAMYSRTVKLFGWPESFVAPGGRIAYR